MDNQQDQRESENDQTFLQEEVLNEMRELAASSNDATDIDEIATDIDEIASSSSSFLSIRRLFLGTMIFAMAIVGSSLIGYTGGHGVLDPRRQTKLKLVNVDGPPSPLVGADGVSQKTSKATKTMKRRRRMFNSQKSTDNNDDDEAKPLVVVDANDDQIPNGVSVDSIFGSINTVLHASEALECRESVINFVINATDGKDECDGLKRAFDKTCNSDAPEVDASNEQEQPAKQQSEPERVRRLLFESSQPDVLHRKLKALVFKTCWWFQMRLMRPLLRQPSVAFFAEDEVAGNAWSNARYLVDHGLDTMVHMDLSRRLTKEADVEVEITSKEGANASTSYDMSLAQMDNEEETQMINEQEEEMAIDGVETERNVPDATATKKPKPKQSLTLPTANQHVSDTMLGETLLLQKEDTIQKVFDSIVNQTNVTLNEAAVDAAASSKAVQDATAAVSAVLNDPTSVEARTCCASILNVFHENCDTPDEEVVSDKKLFLIVFVLAFCGMVKSLIRHFQIRWLPEAAGCIVVGVLCGAILSFVPHYDISFDGDWFLRIMVPPIVFEAALSINKRSFNRHIWPIMIYAVAGTLLATCVTAFVLHQGTSMLSGCETIPYVESLTFGALISSIDPIAVLSVLNNMGMTDSDSIYVVIFGESLLNDGVALVLFQTLVHFLDESLVIDEEAVIAAAIHCCVVAFGSLCVGVGSGFACTFYYWMMQGCQTPLVEVLLFFCWAFIPYYVCDGIGWSGIVAVVATGFVMDLFVVGQVDSTDGAMQTSRSHGAKTSRRRSFFNVHGHLSLLARTHVGFVAELLSTMMETAIFAYLGVFLFSYRYHWNFLHTFLAIFACCISRAVMIPLLSLAANAVARVQQARAVCQKKKGRWSVTSTVAPHPSPGVIIDKKMQLVLWVAGLRGAMSFALVENIPLYDTVTQQGSRLKPELKAMTSATIVFTVFVLGGYTYYLMEHLGLGPSSKSLPSSETAALVKRSNKGSNTLLANETPYEDMNERSKVRQRTHVMG